MRNRSKPMKLSPIQRLIRAFATPLKRALLISLFLSPALADIGCQHIGPNTIADDRLAYNRAVKTSWEQQTLLNIVRVRYDDLVSFVDVGPILQTHSLMGTTQGTFGASISPLNTIMNTLTPSLSGTRQTTDSPNITYTPLTGAEFARNLNAPIKPSDICNLIESDYSADVLLNLTLNSINEIPSVDPNVVLNRSEFVVRSSTFRQLAQAIECAHGYGDLNFYIQPGTDSDAAKVYMVISDKDCERCKKIARCKANPLAFIRKTLQLEPANTQFEVVAGPRRMKETEIAVRTRSVIGAMRWLSDYVHVPEAHISAGFAHPKRVPDVQNPPLDVEWSINKPRGVFTAVQYKGYWFWIPQNEVKSKFSLIYLRTLLALADTGAKPSPPVLTIPTR